MYEKKEKCNAVLKGITHETQATLKSMCYSGLCFLNVDDIRDLLESLAPYHWQCAYASESFVCPSLPMSNLHAQSPCVDQFTGGCHHHSSFPHDVCSYCKSFGP